MISAVQKCIVYWGSKKVLRKWRILYKWNHRVIKTLVWASFITLVASRDTLKCLFRPAHVLNNIICRCLLTICVLQYAFWACLQYPFKRKVCDKCNMNYLIYLQRCRTTRCSVLAVFIFAFSLFNFVPHYPFLRFHCSFCAYSIRFWDVRAYNLTLFVHVLSLFVLPLSLFVLCFLYLFMFSCAFTIRSFLALSLLVLWFRYSFSAYRIRFLSFHNLILCFHYSFLPFHCSFGAFTIRSWYRQTSNSGHFCCHA